MLGHNYRRLGQAAVHALMDDEEEIVVDSVARAIDIAHCQGMVRDVDERWRGEA